MTATSSSIMGGLSSKKTAAGGTSTQPGADLLHPLSTVEWKKCFTGIPVEQGLVDGECVLWRDKICVIASHNISPEPRRRGTPLILKVPQLVVISSDLSSWKITSTLPDADCTLTTYRSSLVLVGGSSRNVNKSYVPSDKLWVSDDGVHWQSSLPPMPTKCMLPLVVNTQNPEYLVVAGGSTAENRTQPLSNTKLPIDTVEVFAKEQWSQLQALPYKYVYLRHTIHDGMLYVAGECSTPSRMWKYDFGVKKDQLQESITFVSLQRLIAACEGKCPDQDIWQYADKTPCNRNGGSEIAFCGQRLITVGAFEFSELVIHAYSPLLPAWIHVASVPISTFAIACCVSPVGDLVVVGKDGPYSDAKLAVFKLSIKVSPFGVNDPFSVKSLYALEAAGVPVVTSITENFKQFCKLCKLSHSSYQSCSQAIEEWEENVETPPTWRHLFDVLKQMDLEELVQEIENYLGSVQSLKQLSMSVITSALREVGQTDELDTRLPEYVPTSVKHSIMQVFKAHSFKSHTEKLVVMDRE